MTIMMVKTGRC